MPDQTYTTGLFTGSAIINQQLVPQVKSMFYNPFAVGPIIQGVPASPPQSPPGYSSGSDNSIAAVAGQNPWSPFLSPVPWLIGMFVVGYLLLRFVHYGYFEGMQKGANHAKTQTQKERRQSSS